ncbi:hypothetical protein ACR3K2_10980 [Cryptosporidium serpentis]
MKLYESIRDIVLPGTFGTGRRAYFTEVIATIYQIAIFIFVIAAIYNSFRLYVHYGRINSFVTTYSESNSIEAPSIIFCYSNSVQVNKISSFNTKIYARILYNNHLYYSLPVKLHYCQFGVYLCMCSDIWTQTFYGPMTFYNQSIELYRSDFKDLNVYPPGKFPLPKFIKDELDRQAPKPLAKKQTENKHYKPHLVNWCNLSTTEINIIDAESKLYSTLQGYKINFSREALNTIQCEFKDAIEFLIMEDEDVPGYVGFYTSKTYEILEPMWIKVSTPSLIFAYLQLEKNWIIDFQWVKNIFDIWHLFSRSHRIKLKNSSNYNNEDEVSLPSLVTESHQLAADIVQIHGNILPTHWWILPSNNDDIKIKSFLDINKTSTLWIRAEYQSFFTPNTVRVANKHFLLALFGLAISILFSLNYLSLFYSVFPFYRGDIPKLKVSFIMKFLSCNLIKSYHDNNIENDSTC